MVIAEDTVIVWGDCRMVLLICVGYVGGFGRQEFLAGVTGRGETNAFCLNPSGKAVCDIGLFAPGFLSMAFQGFSRKLLG
jgi:hypothetical protein